MEEKREKPKNEGKIVKLDLSKILEKILKQNDKLLRKLAKS